MLFTSILCCIFNVNFLWLYPPLRVSKIIPSTTHTNTPARSDVPFSLATAIVGYRPHAWWMNPIRIAMYPYVSSDMKWSKRYGWIVEDFPLPLVVSGWLRWWLLLWLLPLLLFLPLLCYGFSLWGSCFSCTRKQKIHCIPVDQWRLHVYQWAVGVLLHGVWFPHKQHLCN